MKLSDLGEWGLIHRLTSGLDRGGAGVIRGVGDDAAVLKMNRDLLVLATCDAQIEGVHFTFATAAPEQIGQRAAAVNLSDIAAMGGTPTYALVSLSTPETLAPEKLDGIYAGLVRAFDPWKVEIVGGNTARMPERTIIDVTLLGQVREDHLLLRNTAEPGDFICVTGDLGRAAAGLVLAEKPDVSLGNPALEQAMVAHQTPTPRVREGMVLGRSRGVTGCIDISDGLVSDAGHIAKESRVAVAIDLGRLPISLAAQQVADVLGVDAARFAAAGGEDFELLFSVRPENVDEIIAAIGRETGTAVTVIGHIDPGDGGVTFERQGQPVALLAGGFDHFKRGG
ncbi:MAG: thiamine-phosphate kinase [Myxococcota bacterium]|nr:thiamine-phosphate kinase [Myxococcota bacterium]